MAAFALAPVLIHSPPAYGADPGVAVETAGAGFEPGLFVMPAMMMVMLGVGVVAED